MCNACVLCSFGVLCSQVVVHEMGNVVTVLERSSLDGGLSLVGQPVSTLPDHGWGYCVPFEEDGGDENSSEDDGESGGGGGGGGAPGVGSMGSVKANCSKAAEVRLLPLTSTGANGAPLSAVYVSNRGHDSLRRFHLNEETGALVPIGSFTMNLPWPRSFAIIPAPTPLVIVAASHVGWAGDGGDKGEVVVFEASLIDGALSETSRAGAPSGGCILAAASPRTSATGAATAPTWPPPPPLPAPPAFDGVVRNGTDGTAFAYLIPPYKSNHASTIEVLPDGTLAVAWFSGAKEEADLCAIVFATLPFGSTQWSAAATLSQQKGFSNQNPVLFYDAPAKLLRLYHSHAPAQSGESKSVIFELTSADLGKTWTVPTESNAGRFDGAFPRNRIIPGLDGSLLFPIYNAGDTNPFKANFAIIERSSTDPNRTNWTEHDIAGSANLVQPTVVRLPDKSLRVWFRDRKKVSIYTATSTDDAATWSKPVPAGLPNPNVGIEAFGLTNGHVVMIFNNYNAKNASKYGRTPLNIGLSLDGGKSWPHIRTLQETNDGEKPGAKVEFSYPTVLQTANDGAIHVAYTYDRDCIKYRRLTEAWITQQPARAATSAPCTTDLDCSLNGVCAAGECACDAAWGGPVCAVLRLLPTASSGDLRLNGTSTWGMSVIPPRGDRGDGGNGTAGTWHGYFAEMAYGCGLTSWETNSFISHAVADSPAGPWVVEDRALGIWAHTPSAAVAHDGTILLFHLGSGVNGSALPGSREYTATCHDGYSPCGTHPVHRCNSTGGGGVSTGESPRGVDANASAAFGAFGASPRGAGAERGFSFHFASHPSGPWEKVTVAVDDARGLLRDGDNFAFNTPFTHPNGTIYVVTANRAVLRAYDWRGPYEAIATNACGGGEDNYLYVDHRGHFHCLFHKSPFSDLKAQGGHGFSVDGINWHSSDIPAYSSEQLYADGHTATYGKRERPHLIFDPASGEPTHLVNGVCLHDNWAECNNNPWPGYFDRTFTTVSPLNVRRQETHVLMQK